VSTGGRHVIGGGVPVDVLIKDCNVRKSVRLSGHDGNIIFITVDDNSSCCTVS
jgi:hypothetical protein